MVVGKTETNKATIENVQDVKTTVVQLQEDAILLESNSQGDVETRDDAPEVLPQENEEKPTDVKPEETNETTQDTSTEQCIVIPSSQEAAKACHEHAPFDLKFWQDAFLKIVYTRISKLAHWNSLCMNDVDEEELRAMFSNYDGEGEEIDEAGYREQIKVFAEFVATNAVIPKADDTCSDDEDPEERKLEYAVRYVEPNYCM